MEHKCPECSQNLNDADLDIISNKIITRIEESVVSKVVIEVEDKFYRQVGKTFFNKILQWVGLIIVVVSLYLNGKGFIKLD